MPATIATATASTIQTAMVYAMNSKWQDVPMQLLVTTTLTPPMMTAAVPNSTSAACAAVTVSQKARAIAKATDQMPATTATVFA